MGEVDPRHQRYGNDPEEQTALGRRRFLTYLVAAPVLSMAAPVVADSAAQAAPAAGDKAAAGIWPVAEELVDIADVVQLAATVTMPLVHLEVGKDGVARLALPRLEMGQGVTTASAMLLAEELDVSMDRVEVTIADARPELAFNQLTAASATMRTFYQPLRVLGAVARGRMKAAAADKWGVDAGRLRSEAGAVHGPGGRSAGYGELSSAAAKVNYEAKDKPELKAGAQRRVVGKPTGRTDARAAVTGEKKFTTDIMPTKAKPTMIKRPPTVKGTVKGVHNTEIVKKRPGVLDVVTIPTGVAVIADTFEHCRQAVNALDVTWGPGPMDAEDNQSMLAKMKKESPKIPPAPLGAHTVEAEFNWAPAYHAPMETEDAVADVRPDGADIWCGSQGPIVVQQEIAVMLGLPQDKVKVHVVPAGGGFGRRAFFEGPTEAAQISHSAKRPVRLMYHRTDDNRHTRVRPPTYHRVRASINHGKVVGFDHRVTQPALEVAPGFGEMLTDVVMSLPKDAKTKVGMKLFSQVQFSLMVSEPYNLGPFSRTLNEVGNGLPTASYRSVPCPTARTCEEIIMDEVAEKLGKDPLVFRKESAKEEKGRAVLDKVAELAEWGKKMPKGHTQGVGYHKESKTHTACVVELDGTDPNDPRVTKVTMAVDIGLALNPMGVEAQMQGCIAEAISLTLRAGLHYKKGLPLEGSYHNYHWLRMKDYPADTKIHIMPESGEPGGAGEVGMAAPQGAIANAYAKATGRKPRSFPLVFPIDFEPYPPSHLPAPEYEEV